MEELKEKMEKGGVGDERECIGNYTSLIYSFIFKIIKTMKHMFLKVEKQISFELDAWLSDIPDGKALKVTLST